MVAVVTACALVFVGWFAAGMIFNVRKGSAVMKWMNDGLPVMGERTTVRWLGSTTVEMAIQRANAPFDRVAVVIFLEPRDVPWMWALARMRGRRDALIVRANLRASPRSDVEVLDTATWSGRDALRRFTLEDWLVREAPPPGRLAIYHKTGTGRALAETLVQQAEAAGLTVQRLSVRRGDRGFEVHVPLPPAAANAADLFRAIQALGEHAA